MTIDQKTLIQRVKLSFHSPRREALWKTIRPMTADHISNILDFYLETMLYPVSLYTDRVHESIAESIALMVIDKRRKPSNQSADEAIAQLFHAMHGDREHLPRVLISLGIERTMLLNIIISVIQDSDAYLSGIDPYPIQRHLMLLMEDFILFRDIVLNRYIPLITKQSTYFVWGRRKNGLLVEDVDSQQNYFLAAMRSLDKFSESSGTLTGFMQKWLRSASNSMFTLHIGESFPITRSVRRKIYRGQTTLNNFSVNIHDDKVVEAIEGKQDSLPEFNADAHQYQTLKQLVKILRANGEIDRYRLALMTILAPYTLSPAEIAMQRASVAKRGTLQ